MVKSIFRSFVGAAGVTLFLVAGMVEAFEVQAQQVSAARAVQAGVAAAVRGDVRLVSYTAPQTVGREISSGDPVFLGDKVESGPNAGLQIMLIDETIFTIGPDSAIVIDRFVYDPEKSAGKVGASVIRGVFRFVSGRVAANKPSDMEVKLPNGVIGIRGTSAAGFVRNGESQVVLLGPGPDNNVGEPGGRIIVSGGGADVNITRPNFGTVVSGAAAPTPPVRWTPQQMNALTGALRVAPASPQEEAAPAGNAGTPQQESQGPQQEQQENQALQNETAPAADSPQSPLTPASETAADAPVGVEGSVTQQAGQDVGAAVIFSGLLNKVSSTQTKLGTDSGNLIETLKATLSGITMVAQLTQIATGTFNYGTVNVPFTANSSYDFNYSLDFSSRTHTGSVTIHTSTADGFGASASGTFNLLHDPFTSANSSLSITEGGTGTHVPGLNSNDNRIQVDYRFVNDGGLATRIEHQVQYREPAAGGGTSLSASGSNDRPNN